MHRAGCCQRAKLTFPSMTATQELVVPKSMPMTSLPEANTDALWLQSQKRPGLGLACVRRHGGVRHHTDLKSRRSRPATASLYLCTYSRADDGRVGGNSAGEACSQANSQVRRLPGPDGPEPAWLPAAT